MWCPAQFPSLDFQGSKLKEASLPKQYQLRLRLISHWLYLSHMLIPKNQSIQSVCVKVLC